MVVTCDIKVSIRVYYNIQERQKLAEDKAERYLMSHGWTQFGGSIAYGEYNGFRYCGYNGYIKIFADIKAAESEINEISLLFSDIAVGPYNTNKDKED